MKRFFYIIYLFGFLQACSNHQVAPVDNRKNIKEPQATVSQNNNERYNYVLKNRLKSKKGIYHAIKKGDTLYSIAWKYHLDYKDLASWNKIKYPYTIYPGQRIHLVPSSSVNSTNKKAKVVNKKLKTKKNKKNKKVVKKETPPKDYKLTKWIWPTLGSLIKSTTSKKGINIVGKHGQAIKATASGDVVYSGSGLLGYGKLIIIKHNETFLSAYAYNSKILVKEGDRVKSGQKISHMGKDNTGRSLLYFEIRKNGKPVSPIKYLPKN